MMRKVMACLWVFGSAAGAWADDFTSSTRAFETGTIRATGPNVACSGDQFVNVEGVNAGEFASYAVARFDVSAMQAQFDALFGSGNWSVSQVQLEMTQTGAPFAVDGFVDLSYSDDDVTDAKTSDSPLAYPFSEGGVDDLPSEFVAQVFVPLGVVGDIDTFDVTNAGVNADIEDTGDGVVTFVLVEGDPDVATSHRGQHPYRNRDNPDEVISTLAPRLVVIASGNAGAPNSFVAGADADETGTIQPTGPRAPCNGDRFLNVEGANNAEFASYGVLRFDLSDALSQFNAVYGAGNWSVASAELQLTQEPAAFSVDGFLDWYYSPEDDVDVKTVNSPLLYPFEEGGQTDLQADLIASDVFYTPGEAGQVDTVDLSASAALKSDIQGGDGFVTLVVTEGDPDVAATYRGQAPFMNRRAPRLVITAQEGGGGGDCNGREKLKATCKPKGDAFQIKASVKKANENVDLTFRLDGNPDSDQTKNTGIKGKAKATFKNVAAGDHTVLLVECGESKDSVCQ